MSAETLLAQAGILSDDRADDSGSPAIPTEDAIRADPRLTGDQKEALLAVYRSYVAGKEPKIP